MFLFAKRLDVAWKMGLSDIGTNDWDGMLVGCVSSLSCGHGSTHHMKLILSGTLCVLIIDSRTALSNTWPLNSQVIESWHIWYLHRIHTFSYGQLPHLKLDSLLILHFFNFLQPFSLVLLSLLFVDLLLECNFHCLLLLLPFILHNSFLISTLGEDVAMSLELHIDPIFKDTPSGLDIREVLLGNTGIEVFILMWISTLPWILRYIKSFIIELIGIVLIIGSISG